MVNVPLFASVGMKNCNNVKNLSVGKAYMETPLTMEEFIKSVELKGYFISFSGDQQPNSGLCHLNFEVPRPHTHTPLNK